MATTFIADTILQQAVAGALKKTYVGDMDQTSYWSLIITNANQQAYGDIVTRLAARGYDPVLQIPKWDRGVEFNTSLGIFWALTNSGQLDAFDKKFIEVLDRRPELYGGDSNYGREIPAVLVTVNGLPIFPMNSIVLTTGPAAGFSSGGFPGSGAHPPNGIDPNF